MAMTYLTKLKPEPMGAHSLSAAYGVNSLVMSEDGASAYISVKDVPAGTPLTNTEYWKIHTDLTAVKQSAEAAAQKANAARAEMLEIARSLTDAVEKSGNPVQAELVGGLPFDRVATALSPIQSGSGDPSPGNIRLISGWAGAKLTRCGKNLCAESLVQGTRGTSGVLLKGTSYTAVTIENLIPVAPRMELYLSTSIGALSMAYRYYLYDEKQQLISTAGGVPYNSGVTVPDGAYYFAFQYSGSNYADYIGASVMARNGVFDSYEPYTGNTYTADFGNTVYGGTLDWQTGVLTVEWGLISSYSGEALPGEWISDRDVYSAGATPTSGAQIAYKLATPTTIQLTPQEIKQLQGVNTLYGDGSISLTGRADKALALSARIAALEAAG